MDTYEDLIEFTGIEVLGSQTFGDYQGDYVFLVRSGERLGVVVVGYGSCSGCDALEGACDDQAELEALAWSIRRDVIWGSLDELRLELAANSGLQWYGTSAGFQEALNELLEKGK